MKYLVAVLALVALANAAPAFQEDVSFATGFLQYVMPIFPSDKMLFAGGIKAAVSKECPTITDQLSYCQNKFAKALGQSDTTIFKEPIQFAYLIGGYYKLQVDTGIKKMCAAQVDFRNCLGDYYSSCTDALEIYKNQIKDNIFKAFTLAGVYDDIEFDCSGGFTQAITNWQCIVTVNNKPDYEPKTKACYTTYNNTVGANPDNRDVYCTAGQILSVCLANAYKDLDDCAAKTPSVQWWACERANRRVKLEGYCHPNTCDSFFPKPTSKSMEEMNDPLAFHKFVQNGGLEHDARRRFIEYASKPRYQQLLASRKH